VLAEQTDRLDYLEPFITGRWAFHLVRSEHTLALALVEEIEQVSDGAGSAQLRGRSLQGITRFFLGQFLATRDLLDRCHGLADPAHRVPSGLSDDAYAVMLAYLALALTCLGYIHQGRSRLDEALSEARRLKHMRTLANVCGLASVVEWLTRSPGVHSEELLALATEHGFSLYLGFATAFRGRSLAARGQAQHGLALLIHGLDAIRATGAVVLTSMLLIGLAEAHAQLGQSVEGLSCLAEAAQIIETTGERMSEAELYRVRGDLLKSTGDQYAGEGSYRQALGVAQRQGAKLFELRASVILARLWRDQGKCAEARDLLVRVYGWFTEGFDSTDLKEAKALLDELA
jgi:tetratricopeptide (TPR) repeat protein